VLAKYANVGPADIRFSYGEHGKPTLVGGQRKDDLCFNLSRSGTVVVIGVACCGNIGVDIERIGTVEDFQGVSDTCFTPKERIQLASYPDPIREKAFFACWTRKEAYLKAKGIGLSMAMDRFLVSMDPNEAASNLEVPEDPEETGRWSLTNVHTWPGYTCAVCHPKGDFQIRFSSSISLLGLPCKEAS
jgi:4'-phosphopantetheinyl transferase